MGDAQTGYVANSNTSGGILDAAMVDLGNGTGALLVISAGRNTTTPGPFASSTQLLAAKSNRVAATIVNMDSSATLYLGLDGATAVLGTGPAIAPGAAYNVPPLSGTTNQVAGQINGIWTAGATQGASITETVG